jgi:hypothetical protein
MLIDQDPEILAGDDASCDGDFASKMNEFLLNSEMNPIAILPKPNRSVMVKSNTVHTIQRVDVAAGVNKRCTLAGFVYREKAEDSLSLSREEMEAAFLSSIQ